MSTNKFEKYAQGKLSGHRTAVDAEALWASIEPVLHPEKKRRSFFWIWALVGLSLSLASVWALTNLSPQNESVITTVSEDTKEQNHQNFPLKDPTEESTTVQSTDSQDNLQDKKTGSQSLSTNPPNAKRQLDAEIINEKSISKNLFTTTENKNNSEILTADNINSPDTFEKNNLKSVVENNFISTTVQKDSDKNEPLIEDEKDRPFNEYLVDNPTPESNVQEIQIIEEAKEVGIEIEAETETTSEELEELIEDKMPPPPRFSSRFAFGLGARGGISSMITEFTADTATTGGTIRSLREDSETKLETLDFGLEALLKSKKTGFYAAIGIDYQRGARRLNFNDFQQTIDSIPGVTTIYVNPITGDSTKEFGMVALTTTTMSVKEIYNYIHFVNVPLSLGYAFEYENWSFGVEASALFNVLTSYKGQIRISENEYYNLKEDESNWFNKNVGPSFRGALQIGYSPSQNFQIVAGPSFRSFTTVSSEDNPLQQRQASLGFQVAARYWLDY